MTVQDVKLSAGELFSLIFRVLFYFPTFASAKLFLGFPTALRRGVPLSSFAAGVSTLALLTCLTPRQIQSLIPDAHRVYDAWIAKKKKQTDSGQKSQVARLKHDIEQLDTGGSLMWLGDRFSASKFVLYIHGGGYIAPIQPGHLDLCWNAYIIGGPGQSTNVAVAVVEYTLTPTATYPKQLRQTCAALQSLLTKGIRPSDIVIGGDSAGGSVTLQVLRHLIEPHPSIEPIYGFTEPLAGAFSVSPPVSRRVDSLSYRDNSLDSLNAPLISRLIAIFLIPDDTLSLEQMQALSLPLEGDLEWLKSLHTSVRSVYVTAGGQEVFRDQVCQFVDAMRERSDPSKVDIQFDLEQLEFHDQILLEGFKNEYGSATKRMAEWVKPKMET